MNAESPLLSRLDYSVLQQCMHCGLCLPTCPTYAETNLERNSPRGRISLMRAIADKDLDITKAFGDEMYFCLGCLACTTACPAGVNYAELFETARADVEKSGVLANPKRNFVRRIALNFIFTRPKSLRMLGRLLFVYQRSGVQKALRKSRLMRLLPKTVRGLEPLMPVISARSSDSLINKVERSPQPRYRVGLLTGCVQDLVYPEVNRDTVDVLIAHDCEVITPRLQFCCGSLHAHNGELELAKKMARLNIELFESAAGSLDNLDAIITNAGGCGSHLKNYGHLLQSEAAFASRAATWSKKLKDIHEWLSEIGIRPPAISLPKNSVTYHESCHLCHGQKITKQPRHLLASIPGLNLVEMDESAWCCGSAGIYNITQPEMSRKLLERKLEKIFKTGVSVVASANPGCSIQLEAGLRQAKSSIQVKHPISLLADAFRQYDENHKLHAPQNINYENH